MEENLIKKLRDNAEIDAVFLTGSYGREESKPYSDIDLVIILKENKNNIRSLYQWIGDVFADIFFFDIADLHKKELDVDLLNWVQKSKILFDKSGELTSFKESSPVLKLTAVSEEEKLSYWQKINYNLIANKRYFESNDPLDHTALELRLLYSVIEVVCGYLALRGIPWKGEKQANKYLEENASEFYSISQKYFQAESLNDRFQAYSKMISLVFTDKYKLWTKDSKIFIKKDGAIVQDAYKEYTL